MFDNDIPEMLKYLGEAIMVNERLKELGTNRSTIRELFEYGKQLKATIGEENVFDFSIGNPNVPPPESVKNSIYENLKKSDIHAYTSAQGDFEVRSKIAAYNNEQWNVGITADDIYLTSGAAAALTIVFNALYGENAEYIVIKPYFPEYKLFIESAGGKCIEVNADKNFHLDVENIFNALNKSTKAVIINSPNNPTGAIYSKEEITLLAEKLKEAEKIFGTKIYLVSDEPYREITYGKEVVNPMNFYDDTIICYSYSKTLSLPGERIGYIAVSPKAEERRDLYAAVCGAGRALGYVCASSLFQRVIADNLGKTSDISIYKRNRDLLYDSLTSYDYECMCPDGAFYLFVKSPSTDDGFFEECKKHGVLVVPSDGFGVKGYVRISYCVATETIERSLPIFEKIIKLFK